jgi:hypothetical protein
MSMAQLQRLVREAEANPTLRHQVRLHGSWSQWLRQVRALGYAVEVADLHEAAKVQQQQRFWRLSQLPSIRQLH